MNELLPTEVKQLRSGHWKQPVRPWLVTAVWLLALGRASVAGSWVEHRQVGPFRLHAEFPLRETGALMNDLRRLPDDLWKALRLPPSVGFVDVYLFGSRSSYSRYLAANLPNAPRERRALYVGSADSSRVFAYRSRHLENDVRHECTHALLHAALPMVPLWLDEGLATYFEVAPEDRLRSNPALRGVLWDIRFGRMASVGSLESLSSVTSFAAGDYRAAWAWVHFMIHGPPEAREVLTAFLADIQARQPPGSLYTRLRLGVPDLERRFEEHHRRQ